MNTIIGQWASKALIAGSFLLTVCLLTESLQAQGTRAPIVDIRFFTGIDGRDMVGTTATATAHGLRIFSSELENEARDEAEKKAVPQSVQKALQDAYYQAQLYAFANGLEILNYEVEPYLAQVFNHFTYAYPSGPYDYVAFYVAVTANTRVISSVDIRVEFTRRR